MIINNDSYDLRLNLAFTWLIVALFIIFNPFYALFFSSLINIFLKTINFKLFSFLFALSFALMFTNNGDLGTGGDVRFYILRYSEIISISDTKIFIEPLWVAYTIILNFVFSGNQDFFVLFNYFLLFLFVVILSRLINRENYIIVLFTLIFFNLALLYGVYQLWRHAFAMLLMFVGVYTTRARLMLYLAPLVHIVTLPFLLIGSRLNYKTIVLFMFVTWIMFSHILDRIGAYALMPDNQIVNPFFIISAMVIFILKYLQLIQLNYLENRIFYVLIVFAFVPFFLDINSAFSVIYDRTAGIFMFFTAIMVAKFVNRWSVISVVFIFVYFIYRIVFSFNNPDVLHTLTYLGDGRPLYIFNGIFLLMSDFDANRWSDYMPIFEALLCQGVSTSSCR